MGEGETTGAWGNVTAGDEAIVTGGGLGDLNTGGESGGMDGEMISDLYQR